MVLHGVAGKGQQAGRGGAQQRARGCQLAEALHAFAWNGQCHLHRMTCNAAPGRHPLSVQPRGQCVSMSEVPVSDAGIRGSLTSAPRGEGGGGPSAAFGGGPCANTFVACMQPHVAARGVFVAWHARLGPGGTNGRQPSPDAIIAAVSRGPIVTHKVLDEVVPERHHGTDATPLSPSPDPQQ